MRETCNGEKENQQASCGATCIECEKEIKQTPRGGAFVEFDVRMILTYPCILILNKILHLQGKISSSESGRKSHETPRDSA